MSDSSSGPQEPAVEIDVRGLVCPEPVVKTREALEKVKPGTVVIVTTDSPESRDNLVRFAQRAGCAAVTEETKPGVFIVRITKASVPGPICTRTGTTILVTSERLGSGDDKLGLLLMTLFLRTLTELPSRPSVLALMNSGVNLALAGSEHLPSLRTLADQGVKVMVCGTCVDFFGVKERVAVGMVSNMYELAETLVSAEKVVVF